MIDDKEFGSCQICDAILPKKKLTKGKCRVCYLIDLDWSDHKWSLSQNTHKGGRINDNNKG